MKANWDNFWQKRVQPSTKSVSWSKKRILYVLEPYLFENKKVLDAGCGSGFFSRFFCDRGLETVSLDYSDAALELTAEATAGKSQIQKLDLLSQDLSHILPQRFDLIFTDGLFEHFNTVDQDRIMKNFLSILASQGAIITFVPNRWSPWQIIRPFFMPGIQEQAFTLPQLVELNERNGLRVMVPGGVNSLPYRFSPEGRFAERFGMLLYTISTRKSRNTN